MSNYSIANGIINTKYKRLMTQKEKKQNNRELKFKFAESERKSIREEDDIKNVDLSVKEGYFKTEAYDVILLKFDKRLQEIDEQFKSNEELTEKLLKDHQECISFVDEFFNEDDWLNRYVDGANIVGTINELNEIVENKVSENGEKIINLIPLN